MPSPARSVAFLAIGLVVGLMSGLFGVGGGVLIVPALVLLMRFEQKRATGTSLLAVGPIAIVGGAAYAIAGHIDWFVGGVLAVGMVAGGALGSWLLMRLRTVIISWLFVAVMVAIAVQMLLAEPVRGVPHPIGPVEILILLATGLLVGTLSGLIGVGGGIVIVPTLMLYFGVEDLLAKGASLLALVPNAATASYFNLRRRIGDIRAGLLIGVGGALTVWPGMLLAELLDPRTASILFGIFLLVVAGQLAVRVARRGGRGR